MKQKTKNIIITSTMLPAFIAFIISFLTPALMGKAEIIRIIIKDLSMIPLGIMLLVIGILYIKNLQKPNYSIIFLIIGITFLILASNECSKAVLGLQTGPILIDNGTYELYLRSNPSAPGSYYIITTTNTEKIKIRISKSTYYSLNKTTPDVKISYYPYINVAEQIIPK
ncbi:MAG: hypothetical protein K2M46_09105 [Lachnospiraceae bacterium]|nr:hypothetical protein [Lachnospiraceae bacterium]